MNLKPEYAAMLNADKISIEDVYRLRKSGWVEIKNDYAGRCKVMMRTTYANGVTRYERITGKSEGVVTLEIWGTKEESAKFEVSIADVK